MLVHEFAVSWNTRTRFANRHYCRYFTDKEKAIQFARKKKQNPLTEFIQVREQEAGDVDGVLTIHVINWAVAWEA